MYNIQVLVRKSSAPIKSPLTLFLSPTICVWLCAIVCECFSLPPSFLTPFKLPLNVNRQISEINSHTFLLFITIWRKNKI